ncbi:MAG TPA: hypothetical protein K8U78_02555 [Aeriscardovia aeriphila]|uniref:Uncharacterized protein n=1 Tax=Aeriscardovia aeriphila TaxID=218139 RepID=A0A921FVC2_9BIFI|nr:hypothetical protein [Aeriscardovia aeriphila]
MAKAPTAQAVQGNGRLVQAQARVAKAWYGAYAQDETLMQCTARTA